MPKQFKTKRYTLLEAFEAVGRRHFGKAWTGEEAGAREPPRPRIIGTVPMAKDDAPDWERMKRFDTKPKETDTRATEERDAWVRGEAARKLMSEIIRDGGVATWIEYEDGKRRDIQPAEWEARRGPLWLNYVASLGGYKDEGTGTLGEGGSVFLDGETLKTRLPGIPQDQGRPQAQRKVRTAALHEEFQQIANKIWQDNPNLTKFEAACQIVKSPVARDQRLTGGGPLKPETIMRLIRRRKVPASI